MKQRMITGALLILLLAVMLWLPGWCMATAVMICIGFAVWEEYHALKHAGHRVVSWPTWTAMGLSIPLAYFYGQFIRQTDPTVMMSGHKIVIPLVIAALLAMVVHVLFRGQPELTDMMTSALPLLTVALPGLCLVSLSLIDPYLWWHAPIENKMPWHAVEVVILTLTIAIPLIGDMMALFVGKAFGRRKFCPEVSPKKTIEGSIGGLAGSVLAAVIVWLLSLWLCDAGTRGFLPPWWVYPILGLIGGFVGQMGDLFASLVKRHCGLKDYSSLFPGHGGMLDRLDSVLFMAVMMYCYLLFFPVR